MKRTHGGYAFVTAIAAWLIIYGGISCGADSTCSASPAVHPFVVAIATGIALVVGVLVNAIRDL